MKTTLPLAYVFAAVLANQPCLAHPDITIPTSPWP